MFYCSSKGFRVRVSIRLHAFHQSNLSQVKLASASNTSLNPKEKSFNLEGGKRSPVLRTINISLEDKARAALCSFTHLLPPAGMTDRLCVRQHWRCWAPACADPQGSYCAHKQMHLHTRQHYEHVSGKGLGGTDQNPGGVNSQPKRKGKKFSSRALLKKSNVMLWSMNFWILSSFFTLKF